MRKTLLFALLLPVLNVLYGQPQADIVPLRTERPVEIDGKLDDPAWQNSEEVSNFWQTFPMDSTRAEGQTEVQMAYDDDYLYVAVIAHSTGDEFVIPSLRRDYSFRFNDNITLVFDTYNDKTNAFVFGMNPYGVRREALIANGGRQGDDFAASWDNKWFGEASRKEDCWVAEFAIPFKILRFQKGSFVNKQAINGSEIEGDFNISPVIRQLYNGFRAGMSGSLTYRFQPYGSVSMTYNYNHIKLDDPFEAADIWLVGPRFDFTFTRSLFLTTFVQYNSQLDNVNINTRFQWRFAPVSDFFLVYTDNYLTDSFSQFAVRNRALVAKVTYWLNL